MGRGCERLTRKVASDSDVTTCVWKDGRVGVYQRVAQGGCETAGADGDRRDGHGQHRGRSNYDGLVAEIAQFFHTGSAPVDVAETLEVFEFMTAAQISKEKGGAEPSAPG